MATVWKWITFILLFSWSGDDTRFLGGQDWNLSIVSSDGL